SPCRALPPHGPAGGRRNGQTSACNIPRSGRAPRSGAGNAPGTSTMLTPLDLLLFGLAALFLVAPVLGPCRFALLFLSRFPAPPPDDAPLPFAAVVLSLRGADPSLRDCLRSLLRQDYPRYRLLIVIDGPGDPAWAPVRDAMAAGHGPNVEVRA